MRAHCQDTSSVVIISSFSINQLGHDPTCYTEIAWGFFLESWTNFFFPLLYFLFVVLWWESGSVTSQLVSFQVLTNLDKILCSAFFSLLIPFVISSVTWVDTWACITVMLRHIVNISGNISGKNATYQGLNIIWKYHIAIVGKQIKALCRYNCIHVISQNIFVFANNYDIKDSIAHRWLRTLCMVLSVMLSDTDPVSVRNKHF